MATFNDVEDFADTFAEAESLFDDFQQADIPDRNVYVLIRPLRGGWRDQSHSFWMRVPSVPVGVDVAIIEGEPHLGPFTQKQRINADRLFLGRSNHNLGTDAQTATLLEDAGFNIEVMRESDA